MISRAIGSPGRLVRALALATVALGVTAAAPPPHQPRPAAAAEAPAPQLTRVRFGSPQAVSDAGVFLGRERGFFQAQGIEVETIPFDSGPNVIAPLGSGELEVGGGNFNLAVLNAVDRGVGIKIVADKGQSRPGFEFSQLPVRRDLIESGAVRTPADLRGRRLGVASLRAGAEVIAARVLLQGGLTVDDVDLTVLSYPDMLTALANGAIDGGVLIEPTLSAAVSRGLVAMWEPGFTSVAFNGPYQAGVLYFSDRFAAQTDLARRFMVAYLQGVRVYNDAFVKGIGRADVIRVLTQETPIRDPAVYDQMNMAGLDPDGRLQRASMQIELDYFRQRGYYTGAQTVDSVVDSSFAEYAAALLGPYE